jgi:hypothetical protein
VGRGRSPINCGAMGEVLVQTKGRSLAKLQRLGAGTSQVNSTTGCTPLRLQPPLTHPLVVSSFVCLVKQVFDEWHISLLPGKNIMGLSHIEPILY